MTPSYELSLQEKEAIQSLFKKWIPKLNFQNALLHFEARCRPESIYKVPNFDSNGNLIDEKNFFMPIEINMRLGAPEPFSMVKSSCNINLIQEACNIALNLELDTKLLNEKIRFPRHQSISHHFLINKKDIYLDSVEIDFEKLRSLKNVAELSIFRPIDYKLNADYDDYLGWITVANQTGLSLDEHKQKLEQCISCVELKFRDFFEKIKIA
jgi:hypothetical protein